MATTTRRDGGGCPWTSSSPSMPCWPMETRPGPPIPPILTSVPHGMARRGTADIFGIVTTFYVQTQPPPAAVINFAFDILAALASKETAADAFLQVLTFALNASAIDRRLGFGIYVDQTAFLIRVTFFGSVDELSSRAVSSSAGSPEGMVHIPRVISTD